MGANGLGFLVTANLMRELEYINAKFQSLWKAAQAANNQAQLKELDPVMAQWWQFYRQTYTSFFVSPLIELDVRKWQTKAEELRIKFDSEGTDVSSVPGGGAVPGTLEEIFNPLIKFVKWTGVVLVVYLGVRIYSDVRALRKGAAQTAGFGYTCARRTGKLTTTARHALPASSYGLPGKKAYPMPDVSHAINAKARASAAYHRGQLTKTEYEQINRKANSIINACRGRA